MITTQIFSENFYNTHYYTIIYLYCFAINKKTNYCISSNKSQSARKKIKFQTHVRNYIIPTTSTQSYLYQKKKYAKFHGRTRTKKTAENSQQTWLSRGLKFTTCTENNAHKKNALLAGGPGGRYYIREKIRHKYYGNCYFLLLDGRRPVGTRLIKFFRAIRKSLIACAARVGPLEITVSIMKRFWRTQCV